MQQEEFGARVEAVRRFNRFFTRHIGVLREGLLHSPYSLTEVRILFEIANRDEVTATDLSRELGLDPGYLSRTLARLRQQGLIEKTPSESDARRRLLSLTPEGREEFSLLDKLASEEVAEMLRDLSEGDQRRLLEAMRTIEEILAGSKAFKFSEPFYLRPPEPGDMGWVVHRHGVLYAQEYGWDERFEALVARIVADFINNFDPQKERCWIAEMEGEVAGCVFLVKESETIAKLRLLLVEPGARGLGLGSRLVQECIRFAKSRSYKKLTLWTNSVLEAARHIYEKHGFELAKEEEHHSFGHRLTGEYWELEL
ncbi:GNAT family N-acetyltransferase [Rubrobacter taiwanensis]|jgi:DNA-binding MarR family transcriptional regulator/GNAT superfamily N-acetyltransferase|uniref:GNAT family N-acetyltransferase n=1 Tax=Rubrobacter taiwanensis TaxID=185139 RepID=A0A4R1BI04_9ACTN|nr:helix-turn-helix domain-containing GNAT family N-acetyltransferase [Rubrobacter taiwanensis]TCJ16890.1 GNAT family N-acetyltransferase [Rubrobacter taiwanensis]